MSRITKEMEVILKENERKKFRVLLITDIPSDKILYGTDCTLHAYRGKQEEYHPMASVITLVDYLVLAVASLQPGSIKKIEELSRLRALYKDYVRR